MTDRWNPKTLRGKKIRADYLGSSLRAFVLILILSVLRSVAEGENWKQTLPAHLTFIGLFAIIVAFAALHRFCFGKIQAVLDEDRLYFFNAQTMRNRRTFLSDGYIFYGAIENIHYLSTGRHHGKVVIHGEQFQVTFEHLGHDFVKQVKKMQAADPGFAFPEPGIVTSDTPPAPMYSGLFGEIFADLENDRIATWFDDQTEMELAFEECETIEVGGMRNEHEFYLSLDEESMYIVADPDEKDPKERTVFWNEIATKEEFCELVRSFLSTYCQ